MAIPINIEKLISGKVVENERVEYKKGWNPGAIYRTICAFANDFENIGGGYIIVGAEEEKGRATRPVSGISIKELDNIQKKMIEFNKLINPHYDPKISIETIDGKHIIVIWAPGGLKRPYEVPENVTAKGKHYNYYIRRYSSTVQANHDERNELISLARKTPFDDSLNTEASIEDISPLLVREFLNNVQSALMEQIETQPILEIYRAMDLVGGPVEYLYPKNIALMMFNYHPEKFFPYSRIEIVEFPKGLGDPTFFEKPAITGPVYVQVQKALMQLESVVLKERIYKLPDRPEAQRIWNYPFRALEESIVNSMYHRAWDVREPVVIRILPDSIEIINQGGPDRSVRMDEIRNGTIRNPRYRNRRIGDFLKELDMTEGRGTGIPIIRREMKKNGSPEPIFETGDDYSYFITQLPIHTAFLETDETLNDALNGKDDAYQVSDNKYYTFFNVKHETLNETLNETLKSDLAKILELIHKQAGITQSDIINEIEKSRTTTFRYLNILKDKDWIEYRGARKTGGYHLTDKAKEKLK